MHQMDAAVAPSEAPPPAVRKPSARLLAIQALGAAGWGVFFSVTFLDLLLSGAPVWFPLLVWREAVRARKHSFLPGFLVRACVVAVILLAAAHAPLKDEDRRRIELPGSTVSLEELSKASRIRGFREEDLSNRVTLASNHPTLGEVVKAVEEQTRYVCSRGYCGVGVTVLWGKSIMGIGVAPR